MGKAARRRAAPGAGLPASVADVRGGIGADRHSGLDALRGFAVSTMILQHLIAWLWGGYWSPGAASALMMGLAGVGGIAAPLFTTLAGIGSQLGLRRDARIGRRRLVSRGLLLLGLAYVLTLSSPSWFTWRSFHILHLLSVGLLLASLLTRLGSRGLALVALGLALAAGVVQAKLGVAENLNNALMAARSLDSGSAVLAALRCALGEGLFPLFPWIVPVVLGILAGSYLRRGQAIPFWVIAGPLTLGCVGLWLGSLHVFGSGVDNVLNRLTAVQLPFFPASASMVLFLGGISLVLVQVVLDLGPRKLLAPGSPLTGLGRISLTMLMVHIPLFRDLSQVLGIWKSLSPVWTLTAVVATLAIGVVAARVWRRYDYRFGAEWVLRLGDAWACRPRAGPGVAREGEISGRSETARG